MVAECEQAERDGIARSFTPSNREQQKEEIELDLAQSSALAIVGLDFDGGENRPDVVLGVLSLLLAERLRVPKHFDL